MIVNEEGQVAIRRIPPRDQYVRLGNDHEYVFKVNHDISISWVNEEDVPAVLAITVGCCGGRKKNVFIYADDVHLNRWINGGR